MGRLRTANPTHVCALLGATETDIGGMLQSGQDNDCT
ncbi:hypothetical protein RSAG8_04602, partial [Rhizoctonia solani AG-8 WAC10335]